MNLREKIKKYSTVNPETGCWEWDNYTENTGYGQLRVSGVYQKAHRVSYSVFVGKIPPGHFALHKCDNPKCVNPDHLFTGTHQDNMDDMVRKGRSKQGYDWSGRKHTESTKAKMRESAKGKHVGKKNSQYGTMWVYNIGLRQNKKIPRFELPEWKRKGWIQGRKMKF